ncbi:hypothetical protein [Actinomadura verrucosospora]|uniref:Uncharacterized protein n=1 Tax=Actinomadura verrucosospora TaxID=46165 RepID=A0A7D3VY79_ACTVE|nr:hypothetical protein [Actinomadura verrucosospora]QKG21951.1 hypothetical protein ACTIVE_3589 [Actinomadura verrucosospora]
MSTVETMLVAANAGAAVVAGAASVLGAARPGLMLASGETVTSGVGFYARVYAIRAIPLSIAVIAVLLVADTAAVVPLLVVAGVIQAGDAALGVLRRVPGMAAGGGVLAVVHLLSAHWYATH